MNHEQLRALAVAATTEQERTKEGFDLYRAANRALRRETHPANILALLDEIDALRTAAQAVVDRWDTPSWKDVPATANYINKLRMELFK